MTDNPYKTPKMRLRRPRKTSASRPISGSMILWLIVGMFAAIPVFDAFSGQRLILGLTTAILTVAGLWLNWGPIIPCMFLGAVVFALMADSTTKSHTEAFWNAIGLPVAGALAGTIVGFIADLRKTSKHTSTNSKPSES